MQFILTFFGIIRRLLVRFGPLVAVEVALPGGTLLAVALYLHRRRKTVVRPDSLRPGMAAKALTGTTSI